MHNYTPSSTFVLYHLISSHLILSYLILSYLIVLMFSIKQKNSNIFLWNNNNNNSFKKLQLQFQWQCNVLFDWNVIQYSYRGSIKSVIHRLHELVWLLNKMNFHRLLFFFLSLFFFQVLFMVKLNPMIFPLK